MASVRTCYCKREGNAARGKNNDIVMHNGNRHPSAAVIKKSMAAARTCRSDQETRAGTGRADKRMIDTVRPTEAQPPDFMLSPETSTVLENAEDIINNARIRLEEVCATSRFDAAQRNRNTYSEPPLDDETEERLYVRELVASKFQDTCSAKLLENGTATSACSEKQDLPPVTVRRTDLSAPKFRMSRRRRVDRLSLKRGSDDRSFGRLPSKDSIETGRETTARERQTLSARDSTCSIQVGPSVTIAHRELAWQDLENVHISPDSSRAQNRANTATYTVRHEGNTSDPEGTARTRCVRLDAIRREKPIKMPIAATLEVVGPSGKSRENDFEKIENSRSQSGERSEDARVQIHGGEKRDRKLDLRDPERSKNATSRGAAKFVVIETPRIDRSEKLKLKARNDRHVGIASGDDTEIRCGKDGKTFHGRGEADCRRDDENIADEILAEENQGDRSKPSPAGDVSRKASFRQRENVTARCREAEIPSPYRTIDGHFSHTFNSHNGQEPSDVAGKSTRRRARAPACTDVLYVEDNSDEIDLYRPCLGDLDSILHSNDVKIERVARVARNLTELLSDPEFALHKRQDDNHEKLCENLDEKTEKHPLAFNKLTRTVLETEMKNDNLVLEKRQRQDPQRSTGTSSSAFAREEDGPRGSYSRTSVESSVFPVSDTSDDARISRESEKTSPIKTRLSESSMDRSDVTTFSSLVPALSSTRTEAQTYRIRNEEAARDNRQPFVDFFADANSIVAASKISRRKIRRAGREYADNGIFARLRRDTFQATDRLVTYILQDEKRSVEGKVAGALRKSAIASATVQKLLDHLREADSIRDQTETLDILRNVLINVKNQCDQENDKETLSQGVSNFPAVLKTPAITVDESTSREEGTRAKTNAKEIVRIAGNFDELNNPPVDFSECRGTRESVPSTARCDSTRCLENNKKDMSQTETANVAIAAADAKNQENNDVPGNNPEKSETLARSVAFSNAVEEINFQTGSNDAKLIADKSKDSRVSPAFPEMRGRPDFEFASKNEDNDKVRNSCSEAESLKQISDIRSDDDGGFKENSFPKVVSARSREDRGVEAAGTVISVSVNREYVNTERLGEDKPNVQINDDRDGGKTIPRIEEVIDVPSSNPEEAAKEFNIEKASDVKTSRGKKVLLAPPEASEIKNERASPDASPLKIADEPSTELEFNLARSSTREDAGSLREAAINPRVGEKIESADNCFVDSPGSCAVPAAKSSVPSRREVASRNERASLDIAEKSDSTRDTRNREIRKSMTLASAESRGDGNEISGLRNAARRGNERQSATTTKSSRNYKADALSSSNSSISSTLLDRDDRSTSGTSNANTRGIGTTSETSHSEGELYMPSSCSYSLGEVRVLKGRRDLIEDNAMERDSSVTVLVTRSMLTSLNDSTVSLLESSEHV
ncbi:hypothetical protein PUN28_008077 [Cardiocondyla obscurior]